jgi:hypothetical protein
MKLNMQPIVGGEQIIRRDVGIIKYGRAV